MCVCVYLLNAVLRSAVKTKILPNEERLLNRCSDKIGSARHFSFACNVDTNGGYVKSASERNPQ